MLRSFDESFAPGGEWDDLVARSQANSVFLLSGWLQAWHQTIGKGVDLILPQARIGGRLVAAAAFQTADGVLEFAGKGPSDYCDIVVDAGLDVVEAAKSVHLILEAARDAAPFKWGRLARITHGESPTPGAILGADSGFLATEERRTPAPTMDMVDMAVVEERIQKKSLKRHERSLEKQGRVTCETDMAAARILPQLDEFFDQHVRRWQATESPSLFTQAVQRDFYRRLTETLDATGVLRFTAVRLDGKLVAGHYGFHHGGRFTWYKPSFEPDLAKVSPGEVLLKKLLERARDEGAKEFDFTIGDEAFKLRFATRTREIVDYHITASRASSLVRRLRVQARAVGAHMLGEQRLQAVLRRIKA